MSVRLPPLPYLYLVFMPSAPHMQRRMHHMYIHVFDRTFSLSGAKVCIEDGHLTWHGPLKEFPERKSPRIVISIGTVPSNALLP